MTLVRLGVVRAAASLRAQEEFARSAEANYLGAASAAACGPPAPLRLVLGNACSRERDESPGSWGAGDPGSGGTSMTREAGSSHAADDAGGIQAADSLVEPIYEMLRAIAQRQLQHE